MSQKKNINKENKGSKLKLPWQISSDCCSVVEKDTFLKYAWKDLKLYICIVMLMDPETVITGQEATSGLIYLAFDMYLVESYSQKNNKREWLRCSEMGC